MPRAFHHPKDASFSLRVDPALKAAFAAAAESQDRPAASVVRDFMAAFVRQQELRTGQTEIARQCAILNRAALDPDSDEAEVMRWIESVADTDGWEG